MSPRRGPVLNNALRVFPRMSRTARAERVRNGAIDLSQAGAELKFKIDPVTGKTYRLAADRFRVDELLGQTMSSFLVALLLTIQPVLERNAMHMPWHASSHVIGTGKVPSKTEL